MVAVTGSAAVTGSTYESAVTPHAPDGWATSVSSIGVHRPGPSRKFTGTDGHRRTRRPVDPAPTWSTSAGPPDRGVRVRTGGDDGGVDRELAEAVAGRLEADGWVVRDLQQPYLVTVTRAGGSGVLLVAQLLPHVFPDRRHRPRTHRLEVGVGYGPALDLMPLLTLPAHPILAGRSAGTVTVTGPDDGQRAADRAVTVVGEHAAVLAARYPDLDALVDAVSGQDRLVLLAALGRAEEVRALLADTPHEEDRRFVRQLTRRLDQGLPPAPPVEQTLAIVAPALRAWPGRRALWATARTRNRGKRAAYRAVRRRAGGRTREQIKVLLAAEFRARGFEPDTSEVVLRTSMIELRRRPFGSARAVVAGSALAVGSIRDMVRMFRATARGDDTEPEWLRLPDRAGHRPRTGTRYVPVRLDAAGQDRLEQVRAQATRRIGPWVLVDAWLTRDPAGPVVVHIGQQPVGTVDDDDAYDTAFAAAALFDEDPVLTARVISDPEPILELPLPRPAP